MKLLTLNCHSWQEDHQLDKINYLAKTIKENDYDVIALQEVSQHMLGKQFKGQLKTDNYVVILQEALQKLGVNHYEVVWDFAHIGFQVYEEGLCLLSKHPIIEEESFFVSQTKDTLNWKSRRIVKATINYKGEEIDCYSCHLGWWEDEEEPAKLQLNKLNAKLHPKRRAFLLGDFNNNANVRDKGYDYMLGLGWKDTYMLAKDKDNGVTVQGKIHGWEENAGGLRLDYIFTNQKVEVRSSKVIFNGSNKAVISDHHGVQVEIEL
ncbi:endonuclease/exonuclease/phosphatase family protein [Cellulosilyticum sp. ST5]|uniref:endonuclease/exonuclease/phosphatase family protein n=1 Tax=Cellulosilyticum sp. ST5 TaxID=3055805 RepID=UPI0039773449